MHWLGGGKRGWQCIRWVQERRVYEEQGKQIAKRKENSFVRYQSVTYCHNLAAWNRLKSLPTLTILLLKFMERGLRIPLAFSMYSKTYCAKLKKLADMNLNKKTSHTALGDMTNSLCCKGLCCPKPLRRYREWTGQQFNVYRAAARTSPGQVHSEVLLV